jgi:putative copper resistance protein D
MDNFLFLPRSVAAALFDAAFAGASGLLIARLWVSSCSEEKLVNGLRGRVVGCALVLLAALSAQAILAVATMIGSSNLGSIRGQFADVMTSTHAGRALLCNSAVALLLLAMAPMRRMWQSRVGTALLLSVLAILAATRAATGHPAADGDFTLPELVQFVHLASIAIWSGGVLAAGFFVLPELLHAQQIEAMGQFARRLSQTVTIALLLIVLTGLYNSYRGLGGSLAPLIGTQWGDLLDIKIVLVGLAVAMGTFNRQMLRKNRSLTPGQARRLAGVLRAEATVMLLILGVSAFLANSPPANSSWNGQREGRRYEYALLVSQCLNRFNAGGLASRIVAEEDADGCRNSE